jgi:hypothetical protein
MRVHVPHKAGSWRERQKEIRLLQGQIARLKARPSASGFLRLQKLRKRLAMLVSASDYVSIVQGGSPGLNRKR